jgi:hypothetical protein
MFGCASVATAVTRQGSLSYHEGPQSDHRGLYVDIDAKALLEYLATDNKIQPPQIRTLKTGNPESVAIYHKHMLEYYDQHKMAKRISKLHANHHLMSDSAVQAHTGKMGSRPRPRHASCGEKIKITRLKKHYWSPQLQECWSSLQILASPHLFDQAEQGCHVFYYSHTGNDSTTRS